MTLRRTDLAFGCVRVFELNPSDRSLGYGVAQRCHKVSPFLNRQTSEHLPLSKRDIRQRIRSRLGHGESVTVPRLTLDAELQG